MCSKGSAVGLAAVLGAGRWGNPGSSPFRRPLPPRCPPWKALPGRTFPGHVSVTAPGLSLGRQPSCLRSPRRPSLHPGGLQPGQEGPTRGEAPGTGLPPPWPRDSHPAGPGHPGAASHGAWSCARPSVWGRLVLPRILKWVAYPCSQALLAPFYRC